MAESFEPLPEEWEAHLAETYDRRLPSDAEIRVPLCLGCQEERDRYLDARYLVGGERVDVAVRRFLQQIDVEQIRGDPADGPSETVLTD